MKNVDQDNSFDLRQIMIRYIYHWRYFLVSLLITLSMASVYLYFSKPISEIKATLLIQDEKKSSNDRPTLQEIEIVQSSKLVENEIEIIK